MLLLFTSTLIIAQTNNLLNQNNQITGTLNQSRVRIRKEPNLNGEQIGYLNKDQTVYILDRTTESMKIGDMDSAWYKIKTTDGLEGWSYGYFIDLNNSIAEVLFDSNDTIIRRIDDDMISNVNVIYKSESDAIINIDEIEPNTIVTDILDKPVVNKNIQILSEYTSNSRFRNIVKLLEQFEIMLFPSDIEKINNIEGYYSSFWIQTSDIRLKISKEGRQQFRIFIFEYAHNSDLYDYKLKIGLSDLDIKDFLGQPTSYSPTRNIWVYNSFKTLRQINIFWEDNIINKVQLVSWGGI